MKQKKYYKTWKFWITSLLVLSASSIITSLTLTSCVANSTINKDDIVINDQSGDQEFSTDDNKDLILSVDATSNSGATLCYQWYVNKTNDNTSWQKIDGATSKTYTIPISDIENINQETTWKYKADVYHENNENLRVESKPIPVKIKPPVGGSKPENPSIPETKPDQPKPPVPTPTPPAPDLEPDKPSNPTEPTPPTNPPSNPDTPSTPDNPSIVPSPEHQQSQGIGARLPLDKNGIVTTKYEQEKWIGDNSLSLLIEAKPNASRISEAITKFNNNYHDANVKKMLNSLASTLNSLTSDYNYNQFGTGWILDYSNGSSGNLNDYYIATNMHVMSSYFTFTFDSSIYGNAGSYDTPITVGVRIPFNKTTVSNLNVYISQPKYNTTDQKFNDKSYADKLDKQWYKTNVSIDNWDKNLIPIGAYSLEKEDGFNYSQAFDMELTWQYESNPNLKETLYFKSSENGFITENPVIGNTSFQNEVDDFSVFKISLANNAFDERINKGDENSEMFAKMKNLFNVVSIADIKKQSSYISKLNKLLEIVDSKTYSKEKVDDLFMFGDSKKITDIKTQISIGGYPLLRELIQNGSNSYKWQSYTTYNTNTLTGNNIIDYPIKYYNTRNKMGINQYTYKGNLYKINWKDPNNFILKNVNLLAGSSGGVGIDQDYKLSCINWGTFIQIEYYQGIKYVLDSSSSTGLYSSKDKNNLIWKWVDYSTKNNKQTKLAELFSKLENLGYFNK